MRQAELAERVEVERVIAREQEQQERQISEEEVVEQGAETAERVELVL